MFSPRFGTVTAYDKNQIIFREGEPGNVGYLVRKGEVTIYKIIEGKEKVLSRLGPGEIFGEMGIITKANRTAFAEATADCELVTIDEDTLVSMLKKSPKLIQSMTLLLMKRLASTLDMLEDTDLDGKKVSGICELLDLMGHYTEGGFDYLFFCSKAMNITRISQRDLDYLLQKLIDAKAIEIFGNYGDDNPSDWTIKVISAGALYAAAGSVTNI